MEQEEEEDVQLKEEEERRHPPPPNLEQVRCSRRECIVPALLPSDLYLKGSQLKRRLIVFFCKFSLSSSVESNSGWNPDCTRRANLLLHCARLRIWRNLKILPCHIGSCVTVLSASGLLLTVWVAKQQPYTSN